MAFVDKLARFLARPAVVNWLIERATAHPYTHLSKDGEPYMLRYWLFNPYPAASSQSKGGLRSMLPSVRLHYILRPDADRHLHDHPWDARTFILEGAYTEQRADEYILRRAGTTATLNFGEYHRIDSITPGGVWTLFVTWKYRGTWGFLVNGKKVPWREYLGIK